MKDLRKEMHYTKGDTTSLVDLEKLANELLDLTWTIDIYRHKEAQTYNLRKLGWTFDYNDRKRSAGLCRLNGKKIFVSRYLLKQNYGAALKFEDTIRHEMAHAIDVEMRGTSDHSHIWKAIARQVLCNAERCYKGSEIADKKSKYTMVCDTCNGETPRHKRTRSVQACGKCCNEHNNGKFSNKYIVRLVQNY